jgi:uncharacterized protein (TIGR02231 family)
MKISHCWMAIVISMAAILPSRGQATINADSSISQVTAYLDRARIVRTAQTGLPAGDSVVEFAGLPAILDEGSVAVSAKSDGALTIDGIDLRQKFLSESANPRVQDLERQIREMQDQQKALQSQNGVLAEKREFFQSLRSGLGKGEKEPMNLEEVRNLYEFYGQELSNLAEKILSIGQAEAKLGVEIDRLQRELNELRGAAQKAQRTLLVSVRTGDAVKAEFSVQYTIANSSWSSSYDARVDSATGKVSLVYNAFVQQKTGEDWNNVRLMLSTAQPGRNGQMPELTPSFLDFLAERPEPLAMARALSAPKPADAASAKEEGEMAQATESRAEIQRSGLSINYAVGLPVTIPSDGQPHRTNITIVNLEGTPQYVTTPKLDPSVFLKIHLTNSSEAELLPGPLNLFRDGEFTGIVPMKLTPPASEFDLYVGRDDSVKVERKEIFGKRSESGLLNRKEVEERKYQISLQNFRPNPIRLLLYDQIPISRNADIQVNQGNFSDKPGSVDKDTGKLTWEIELSPKVKKVIEFGYSVEWPKGKEINGVF